MAYLNTTAADRGALLVALTTFLTSAGWTVTGSGTARTLTNANGKIFYLDPYTQSQTDFFTGAFNDLGLLVSYEKTSIGLAAGKSNQQRSNDMLTAFSNVWFFATGTYCHIILQVANARYTHVQFGELDPKGQHTSHVLYAAGNYWTYWPTQTSNNTGGNPWNYPAAGQHEIDFLDGAAAIGIPAGLLDSALFFSAAAVNNATWMRLCQRAYFPFTDGNSSAWLLDYLSNIENHGFTGGVIVSPMPVLAYGVSNDVRAYVGDFPDVGLVNMNGLSPGQTISYGGDDWIVFPVKQWTAVDACLGGQNPTGQPSSAQYGFAYKKIA